MPRLQAALLDMDGLLSDTEPFWQEVEVRELTRLGVPITPEMCFQTVGLRIEEAMGHWQERYPWEGCSLAELCDRVTEGVRDCIQHRGRALPSVEHALDLLSQSGLRLAIASGSRHALINQVIESLNLHGRIELVVSAAEVPDGKPHPEVFLMAAQRLGINPLTCVVFEDSLNGVIAAKAARMKCIAVPAEAWRDDPRFALADLKLHSLAELTEEMLAGLEWLPGTSLSELCPVS